jgi:chlorite dismutase
VNADSKQNVDISERGAPRDGQEQSLDRRLFMQLLVLQTADDRTIAEGTRSLIGTLEQRRVPAVIYADLSHPESIGLLCWSEDPGYFVDQVRSALTDHQAHGLRTRPEMTMLGRSYSTGFEPDLKYWLLRRPEETVLNPDWHWAIWYPLRRSGAFARLDRKAQGELMREHATLGRTYAHADLAHDVRLACHGLDVNDNDFVIGLMGAELHPLSHLVQSMRATQHTAEYIARIGPFFVGRVVWRSRNRADRED